MLLCVFSDIAYTTQTPTRPKLDPLEKPELFPASEELLLELREPRRERPAMDAEQITVPKVSKNGL